MVEQGALHIRTADALDAALSRSCVGGPNGVRSLDPPIRDRRSSSRSNSDPEARRTAEAAQIAT
jgi:hypothetical protein